MRGTVLSGHTALARWVLLALLAIVASAVDAAPRTLGSAEIRVLGFAVDIDTRPDVDGVQSSMTAVKDIPTAVATFVGSPLSAARPRFGQGVVVKAELAGPSLGAATVTLAAAPNAALELPPLGAAGNHQLFDVRLENADGEVILRRDPAAAPILIKVIDELLVTQVTSRPLTLEEIEEKGIVIDEDNFTTLNFVVGLTLGSEQVAVELPVAIPTPEARALGIEAPDLTGLPFVQREFRKLSIPNVSLAGFSLTQPPDVKDKDIRIPPINGVIVIPGNIKFLNQFFSVILQASNVAPEGSGLTVDAALARIVLPLGEDEIPETGDDPLRMAETADGVQTELPLLDAEGSDSVVPGATNEAEFLVEGLREGTHTVRFDIEGELFVPALGESVMLTGEAAGLVQVRNPTFSMVLAHPDVVRDGEAYSLFATVTNTSSTPANAFQLRLNERSLSGARLADGEEALRTLDTLLPGDAETFEFRLVARTTGKVSGTVFLADEGINGSFVLNTGVGDTGIPLSPDTLVLPQTVDYLPGDPDVVFAAVRMLGQAYSVATAPAGALPPDIARISRPFVFDRAVKVAQAGVHVRFGETAPEAVRDVLMDFLGADVARLDELIDDPDERELERADLEAFDGLRRAADAGHDLAETLAEAIGAALGQDTLAGVQLEWAEAFASRPPHLSFAAAGGIAPRLKVSDPDGAAIGWLEPGAETERDIPHAATLPLAHDARMVVLAAPGPAHVLELETASAGEQRIALVVPDGDAMVQVRYPTTVLDAGARARLVVEPGQPAGYALEIDSDGDGSIDALLEPASVEPVADPPPRLLGVHQWGKGAQPERSPSFEFGDPTGRLVGALFSEEVVPDLAEAVLNYDLDENTVTAAALQPDARLVFLVLERPVGPFVERSLTAAAVEDRRGNVMAAETRTIEPDPERGVAGMFTGRVLTADGRPVPYASVDYLQPLSFFNAFNSCVRDLDVRDFAITRYETDARGRFTIDYVLQADFPPGCPTNADIWLNERNPRGTDNFKLEATDPDTGDVGRASSRIQFDGQRLSFDVIIRGFGSIDGRVIDEQGRSIAGGAPGGPDELRVLARNVSTGESYVTLVDEDGRYAFPASFQDADGQTVLEAPQVAVGNIILQVVRPSDAFTAVATVNVPEAGAAVSQDLVMIPPNRYGRVAGRVLEADGVRGAANVPVQIAAEVLSGVSLYARTFVLGVVGSTVTDEDGRFQFEAVPTGNVEVKAVRQSTFEDALAKDVLAEGEQLDMVLVFPGGGGTVRGLVRDALGNAVPDAVVAGGPTLTSADADGRFEIGGLPLGRFTISAQALDSQALGTIEVETTGPADVQEVVITLEPVGSIEGSVFESDGATPVRSQQVQLWIGNGVLAVAYSDDQGRFSFDEVPLAEYNLRAVRSDRGDGGQAFTTVRFAGDRRDADIVFRGLGGVRGRVIQDNGTPALTDVIVTRKVWRIIPDQRASMPNVYLDFVKSLRGINESLDGTINRVLAENGLDQPPDEFFMLRDEPALLSSDQRGPGGEVTGEFLFNGPMTAGPFSVSAFGPFLSPATVSGELPRVVDSSNRIVDVGDIVLVPATGAVEGTVYLPGGETPVGANVRVVIRSLEDSGDIKIPGGAVSQSVLPEIEVLTDADGRFEFPLVLRGRFTLSADTGTPDPAIRADGPDTMQTERFEDEDGNRLLNVRLFGAANGVVPRGETVMADLVLADVAAVDVAVVENDGVTPLPNAEVTLTTKSGFDDERDLGFVRQFADDEGRIRFFPVIEGMFSVSARDPSGPARGSATGDVPVNPGNGLVLPVAVTLGAVTSAGGQVVQAAIFGAVEGQVSKADGEPLTNPAQVTVRASGAELLSTTDETGRYLVENVPGGFFQVDAFEPFTARRGSATGSVVADGETAVADITLVGLGTVNGEVLSNDGARMLRGVDVVLFPSGQFTDRLVSRTDQQGVYAMPGVPLGPYTVKATDVESGLVGQSSDVMERDGDVNTTDVFLEPSGRIEGVVYAPGVELDADGVPVDASGQPLLDPPVAANASVTISGSGLTRTVQADADGAYRSGDFLTLGDYSLRVVDIAGTDGQLGNARLSFDGEVAVADLVLRGQGTVQGQVLDSVGAAPVEVAQVRLVSSSPFASQPRTVFSDTQGLFTFEDVPVGRFSVSVVTTLQVPQLGASVSGELLAHDDVIDYLDGDADPEHDAIRLQAAGAIVARVLLADGASPGAGAIVELRGTGIRLAEIAGFDGGFAFEGVPLGSYAVTVVEPASNGVAALEATLSVNGETLDLGDLVLDDESPRIVAVTPAPDAVNVHPSEPVTLELSERIAPDSVDESSFTVTIDGVPVAGSFGVSPTEPRVSFFPDALLPDLTRVRVRVRGDLVDLEGEVLEPGLRDLAGRSLVEDLDLGFTTGDSTPPVLQSLSPADGAVGVDLGSVIRAEFSEPVDPDTLDVFTLETDAGPVPGQRSQAPILGNRVFVFTPTGPLAPNTDYRVRIEGRLADPAGNSSGQQAIVTTFQSLDTLAPIVDALSVPAGSALVTGGSVAVTAAVSGEDVARVDFFVDGVPAGADESAPFTLPLSLAGVPAGLLTVSAIAEDETGNRGERRLLELQVVANDPPGARIESPAPGNVGQGDLVTVRVSGSDDLGLASLSFAVDGGAVAAGTRGLAGQLLAEHSFSFRVPAAQPTGSTLEIRASATDLSGLAGEAPPVSLLVEDRLAPAITVLAPAAGSAFEPGAAFALSVRADDASGVSAIDVEATGALIFTDARTFSPATSPAAAQFSLTVPADADGGSPILVSVRATDTSGNRSSRTLSLTVVDRVAPSVSLSAPGGSLVTAPGRMVTLEVRADDAAGVVRAGVVPAGQPEIARDLAPVVSTVQSFQIAVPAEQPFGSTLRVDAFAVDAAGNRGESAPLVLDVQDLSPPVATIEAPAPASEAVPGQPLEVLVRALDDDRIASLTLDAFGAVSASLVQAVAPPATPAEHRFALDVPADAAAGASITLRATAVDVSGNASAIVTRLVTVADVVAPVVESVMPADGAVDVSPESDVRIRFSEPLSAATVDDASVSLALADGTSVAVTLALSGDARQVVVTPAAPLVPGAEHVVAVSPAVTDVAGNALVAAFESRFTTEQLDRDGPMLLEIVPAIGATGVSIRPRIEFRFDEPVARIADPSALFLLAPAAGGDPVPAQVGYADGDATLTLTPDVSLGFGVEYAVLLTGADLIQDALGNAARDSDGTPLVTATSRFTTTTFGISAPADGALFAEGQTVAVTADGDPAVGIAEVEFLLGDERIALDQAAPFATSFEAPSPTLGPTRTITAIARDAGGVEVGRDSVTIHLDPTFEFERSILGVPVDETVNAVIRVSSALPGDLVIDLTTSDETVAVVPPSVTLLAGDTVVEVPVTGVGPDAGDGRQALIVAESAVGGDAVVISVSAPESGVEVHVQSSSAGLSVTPLPLSIPALGIPGPGSHRVLLPVLAANAGAATNVLLSSTDQNVLTSPASVTIAAGSRVADIVLTAHAEGEALLRIDVAGRRLTVPVVVSPGFVPPPLSSEALGLGVRPATALQGVAVRSVGTHTILLPLLAEPAVGALDVTLTSSDPDVLTVPASGTVPDGGRLLAVALEAVADGTAEILIDVGGERLRVPVEIGASASQTPISSKALGLIVKPLIPLKQIAVGSLGTRTLRVPLLPAPADGDLVVALESLDPDVVTVPASSVIPNGARHVDISVEAVASGAVEILITVGDDRLRLPLEIATGVEPPPVTSNALGISVSPSVPLAEVAVRSTGAVRLLVPLLAEPLTETLVLDLRSTAPGVMDFPPGGDTVTLAAGDTVVEIVADALGDGAAEIVIDFGGETVRLPVTVGAGARAATVSSLALGVSVTPAGTAGRIYVNPGAERALRVPLLREPVDRTTVVQIFSRDGALIELLADRADIPAGEVDALIPFRVVGQGDAVAIVDVLVDGQLETLEIVIGEPEGVTIPLITAPPLGVCVEEGGNVCAP